MNSSADAADSPNALETGQGENNEWWASLLKGGGPSLTINIMIVGSRGDVQPFIVVGRRLIEYGHRVRLSTHEVFRKFVTDHGLGFYPLAGDPKDLMAFMARHPKMVDFSLTRQEIASRKKLMAEIFVSCWHSCTYVTEASPSPVYRPDLIIANPPTMVHIHIAQKLQIPLQIHFTMPWTATEAFASPFQFYFTGTVYGNYASYGVVDQLLWTGMASEINRFRAEHLGLPPITRGGAHLLYYEEIPHVYYFSPTLVPRPNDWDPRRIHIPGFLFLEDDQRHAAGYQPPEPLKAFLAQRNSDPRPVIYVGFGSISGVDETALNALVCTAIQKANVRAVIGAGWSGLGGCATDAGETTPPTEAVCYVKELPHEWLFPQMDVVVHHGGAGTTACGAKHGIPTVVLPFFGDQFFWQERVANSGLGPNSVATLPAFTSGKLTIELLTTTIMECLDPAQKERAQRVGAQIRSEQGLDQAVRAIHQSLPFFSRRNANRSENSKNESNDASGRVEWEMRITEWQRKIFGRWTGNLRIAHSRWTSQSGFLTLRKEHFWLPQNPNGQWEWTSEDWHVEAWRNGIRAILKSNCETAKKDGEEAGQEGTPPVSPTQAPNTIGPTSTCTEKKVVEEEKVVLDTAEARGCCYCGSTKSNGNGGGGCDCLSRSSATNVVTHIGTDAEGWRYVRDFPDLHLFPASFQWNNCEKFDSFVRCRSWVRTRAWKSSSSNAALMRGKSTTRTFEDVALKELDEAYYYENQKRWPLVGFSSFGGPFGRSAFSDETGLIERQPEQWPPRAGYEWVETKWRNEPVEGEPTDAEGWSYAGDFDAVYSKQSSWKTGVRRRRWVRKQRWVNGPLSSTPLSTAN